MSILTDGQLIENDQKIMARPMENTQSVTCIYSLPIRQDLSEKLPTLEQWEFSNWQDSSSVVVWTRL